MRLLRSPREIVFRATQEIQNLRLTRFPPEFAAVPQKSLWPSPEAAVSGCRNTLFAGQIERLAEAVLEHRFPLLGLTLTTGSEIDWNRDYVHDKRAPQKYFRLLPYLDFQQVGDHKIVWELSRHQHWVLLAQAYRFTGRSEFLQEIGRQCSGWIEQNPFQRSIHWTSALEVAFRAWSWSWVDHLVGRDLPVAMRQMMLRMLGLHGCHLEWNLSVYFSPNTHLLGEALVLHLLGTLYPDWPRSSRWIALGGQWMQTELVRQVQADGAHMEQSSYYHVYALDMFLAHYLAAGRPPAFQPVLIRMAEFLHHLLGAWRSLPLLGDDDGGRLFHPYGVRPEFGCATLATCAALFQRPEWIRNPEDAAEQATWWIPESLPASIGERHLQSRLFAASGLAVMQSGAELDLPPAQIVVDLGSFGPGGAGHSHADTLQVLVRRGAEELLIDPGTFTYVSDPVLRDRFRGTPAHNTVCVDGQDQATPAGPFRWEQKPLVRREAFTTSPEADFADASCVTGSYTHRRRVLWLKPGILVVFDEVTSPHAGDHSIEQNWLAGVAVKALDATLFQLGECAWLWLSEPGEFVSQWRSTAFAAREPAASIRLRHRGSLPWIGAAVLTWETEPPAIQRQDRRLVFPAYSLEFPSEGGWRSVVS